MHDTSTTPKYWMALTAFRRPNYLREVLFTIANNVPELSEYGLHFSLEPGNDEVLATCELVRFVPTDIHVNDQVRGVTHNPFEMLTRMFANGAEAVLYLEDDVVLASDALKLASWFFEHPDRDQYLCLNLYNGASDEAADPELVGAANEFNALGVGITRYQWENYFSQHWYQNPAGWDYSIGDVAKRVPSLTPAISRSHHIGRELGTWYDASRHDAVYCGNPMCTTVAEKFRIGT